MHDFQEELKLKLEDVTWFSDIRDIIFEIEAEFFLEKMDVCFQCGQVTVWHIGEVHVVYTIKIKSILQKTVRCKGNFYELRGGCGSCSMEEREEE